MESKTTQIRRNKEYNLLTSFHNIAYVITHFRGNYRLLDGRELKKVLQLTTSWKESIYSIQKLSETNNTPSVGQDSTGEKSKGIKKEELRHD